eukprot:m.90349 g.90349  ORF g.90349 m.90349 type:complete len:376 (-) comp12915_c0_seq3:1226-2353(-)
MAWWKNLVGGLVLLFVPVLLNHSALRQEVQMLQPMEGTYVSVDGQEYFWWCRGNDQVDAEVVVLHTDLGQPAEELLFLQEALQEEFRVCVYDRWGLGYTAYRTNATYMSMPPPRVQLVDGMEPSEENSREEKGGAEMNGQPTHSQTKLPRARQPAINDGLDSVDYLLGILDAQNITDPITLVAFGAGSIAARFFAQLHEARVHRLVLVNPLHEQLFLKDSRGFKEAWYTEVVPAQESRLVWALTGWARLGLTLGLLGDPATTGSAVFAKHILCHPSHQQAVLTELQFVNATSSEFEVLDRFKPLSPKTARAVLQSKPDSRHLVSEAMITLWDTSVGLLAGKLRVDVQPFDSHDKQDYVQAITHACHTAIPVVPGA